ncbi:MAG TPA: PglZ domain-containing protein [bacterium]|nr:PglZ domain-containing protein [bacterium]HPG47062.1 PglZ domain-containing protein [bacterium]HPM99350.1 PglZ domain-containing protein [bacterium]
MTWQGKIFHLLDMDEPDAKIIIDKIGLLIDNEFCTYLNRQNKKYIVAESLEQVLQARQQNIPLILCADIALPVFVTERTQTLVFDAKRLPIDIESKTLSELSRADIKALIDYQADESKLISVTAHNREKLLQRAREHQKHRRHREILQNMQNRSPLETYIDILEIGSVWGCYVHACWQCGMAINPELEKEFDRQTELLVLNGGLQNAFYESVMHFKTVDRISAYIKNQNPAKFALICFDGMGMAEWQVLQESLELAVDVKPVFALIPTITAISRAAIFYGNADEVYSLTSINENKAFQTIFSEQSCAFFRENELTHSDQLLGIDAVKVVYNVFDDLAHRTLLLQNQANKNTCFDNACRYLAHSAIKKELNLLRENGFCLYLCSDHGSTVAVGNGQIIDNYLIDTYSKRGTLVRKSQLLEKYDAHRYDIPFIKDKVVLLAKDRTSFSHKHKLELTHGGITMDELVVPFVEIAP